MLDTFSKTLQSAGKNSSKFRVVAGKLRSDISTKNYPALLSRIRKNFPQHANAVLIPTRQNKWADLRRNTALYPFLKLDREIAWQVLQLGDLIDQVNNHVQLAAEFAASINQNDVETASSIIDQHYANHGPTLWNLEARIMLASRTSSEAAEEFILKLKPELSGSLAFFIAYLLSDLYDQNTTHSGFSDRLRRLMSAHPGTRVNDYLKCKLLRDTYTPAELANYLATESGFSYVDAYEAILIILVESALSPDSEGINSTELANAVWPINGIRDIRLHLSCNMLSNDNRWDLDETRAGHFLRSEHFPSLEKIGQKLSGGNSATGGALSHVETVMDDLLAQLRLDRSDIYEIFADFSTTISKHRLLPWHKAIEVSLPGIFFPLAADVGYLKYLAVCVPGAKQDADDFCREAKIPNELQLHEYGLFVDPWLRIYKTNPERRSKCLNSLWNLYQGDAKRAIHELDELQVLDGSPYGIYLHKITAMVNANDDKSTLQFCVDLVVERESVAAFLPFDEIVGKGKEWEDLNGFDYVDLAIGLHFAALSGDTKEKDKFNLEVACKKPRVQI